MANFVGCFMESDIFAGCCSKVHIKYYCVGGFQQMRMFYLWHESQDLFE